MNRMIWHGWFIRTFLFLSSNNIVYKPEILYINGGILLVSVSVFNISVPFLVETRI